MRARKLLNPWDRYFGKKEQYILFFGLLAGIIVRVVNALTTPLWRDEVYIFFSSRQNSFFDLLFQRHWDIFHPPAYFIFLAFWQKISINPFFLRLPSLIASFFILLLIPVLAKKIFPKSKNFPFLSLFFFSFSHTQISLNMVVRPYPFTILLTIISMILFIDFLKEEKPSPKTVLLFVLFTFFALSVDYSSVWLILSYWIFWLWWFFLPTRRGLGFKKKELFKGLVLTTALCSLWLPAIIKNLPTAFRGLEEILGSSFNNINPVIGNLWQLPFFAGTTYRDIPIRLAIINLTTWTLLMLFISFLGLILNYPKNKKNSLFLLIIFLIPPTVSFAFSVFVKPIFIPRNLHISNIGLVFGLALFFDRLFKKNIILLSLMLFLWVANFFSAFPAIHYTDAPYDWVRLTKTLANYTSRTTKYIITEDPPYIYDPVLYYNLLWSVGKVEIINIKDVPKYNLASKNKGNIFFAKTSRRLEREDYGSTQAISDISKSLGCSLKRIKINYIYFVGCK